MKTPILYRKRLIPEECILLKDDVLLYRDDRIIVTKWDTLKPKKNLAHGYSCYFLDHGVKVSKFYDHEDHLICWYCDIVSYTYAPDTDTYIFTDLLADVLVYPDGFVKVVDLDELAIANETHIISPVQLNQALRIVDWLLNRIYRGEFGELTRRIEEREE